MVRSGEKRTIRWGSSIGTGVIVLFLFFLFIMAVKWFRSEPVEEKRTVPSLVDVLTPDPISQTLVNGSIDTQSREARLVWVATGESVGTALRGDKDGKYYIELKTLLPEIDREKMYYQVWVLRRLPYDFFSLGEMATDEEGFFVLRWEALDDEDYLDYTEIIITANQYQGSADPEAHLVEGQF
jgi:hypothetical protein